MSAHDTIDEEERTGVLVVGAGPAGLTLAIDLAMRGVPCHVVEATAERPLNPRCNTTSARSMEIFRRLGIAGDIRRAGLPEDRPTSVHYRTTLLGEEIFRIDLPSSGEVLSGAGKEDWPTPEPQHRISQLHLEPVLERHARSLPGLTIERGTRLTGLRRHEDHVEAVVESGGTTRTLRPAYVVGCDGAHSTVRRGLGIRYEGVDALQKFVTTFVRSRALGAIADRDPAWTYWTYGRRTASLIAVDGEELWLNHVAFPPDHDTEDEDPERLLRETVGADVEHDVLGVVRWTGRRLVARQYGEGRVFLAGDAAHLWIPVGGFGMNAGIQDAVTLGWMLAAVHHGWAPPRCWTPTSSNASRWASSSPTRCAPPPARPSRTSPRTSTCPAPKGRPPAPSSPAGSPGANPTGTRRTASASATTTRTHRWSSAAGNRPRSPWATTRNGPGPDSGSRTPGSTRAARSSTRSDRTSPCCGPTPTPT